MGYLHIDNLYKNQQILEFKRVYALEKIHGTSAHVKFKDGELKFFSGGEKYDNFYALFDHEGLKTKFAEFGKDEITVFGEAYGGRCQGMSETYGKALKFVAFDVRFGGESDGVWVDVETANRIVTKLGLEFVDYELVNSDLTSLDAQRDRPSRIAIRNGCGDDKKAEGIVIRPPFEVRLNNGGRLIAKHKRADFSERKSGRDVELAPDKVLVLANAKAVAEEFVVLHRLEHVLDKLKGEFQREMTIEDMTKVLAAMASDVAREGAGEFDPTPENFKAIRAETSKLFQRYLQSKLQ